MGDDMAVMGERLPEAWMVELHRNGRVEFPLRRWTVMRWPLLLPGLFFAAPMLEMLDGEWRLAGYLMILAYAGVVAAVVWQLVTQRPVVIVDRRGIHRGRRRFMGWSDIGSLGLMSGPKLARQFPVIPKDVRAKNLVLGQEHVNDLRAFRSWLDELLDEYRRAAQGESADGGRSDGVG
jgi:type IV secretory pathway TraG/TraD family ATPase VirD4